MEYKIQTLEAFSVIGKEIELTNSKKENLKLCMKFWQSFNYTLKLQQLSQKGNWLKYAFMKRTDGKLYYFCAIPKKDKVPDDFICANIPAQTYLVVEHQGPMHTLYETYDLLYKRILPIENIRVKKEQFLHFEKYDQRFYWNRNDSVIELWIAIYEEGEKEK